MKFHLRALVLALPLASQALANGSLDLFARIEVKTGRAELVQHADAPKSVREGESLNLEGKSHLEVGAGSEVQITYPGSASLRVWGPASLDWQPRTGAQEGIEWHIFQVTWCDVEVRRGHHELNLPGDWRAQIDGGSLRLRGLATGPLEMRLNAGRPVSVDWVGNQSQARPPLLIYPGSNIRLDQPTQAPLDNSSKGSAWTEPTWPYRRTSDTPSEQAQRAARPERVPAAPAWPMPQLPSPVATNGTPELSPEPGSETQAQVPLTPSIEAVRVEVTSPKAPLPVAPQGNEPRNSESTVQPDPKLGTPGDATPVAPALVTTPFHSQEWRQVARRNLQDLGSLVAEQATGSEVRVFAGGRTKVLVDRWEGKPCWVFTATTDYHLMPGAVAVFDDKGQLVMSHGTIENFAAQPGRPSLRTTH
ncbi:MAG: hypothetical protein H6830_05345 [Planctomycetes bacterium]|nr:hypothetical protein [Planctomycetota bacterium]MCB9909247.1 hypothetical protein [Planctomycetota bacterium]HPF13481.1 hypothetical protein [Planctomycetota bacterium]